MKRFLAGFGVLVCTMAFGLFGAGAASAGLEGFTYAKASAMIKGWGATPVIASVVGSQLATEDCIVTNSKKSNFLDSSGRSKGYQFLLDLNCNRAVAAPGKPGNSVASAEGKSAHEEIRTMTWLGQDPDTNCAPRQQLCKQMCNKYADSCPAALQKYVAALS